MFGHNIPTTATTVCAVASIAAGIGYYLWSKCDNYQNSLEKNAESLYQAREDLVAEECSDTLYNRLCIKLPKLNWVGRVKQVVKRKKRFISGRRLRIGAATKAAGFAQSKVGVLTDTQANRLVLSRLIRDFMLKELNMRPTDIGSQYQIAVELALLPTDGHILASQIGATDFFKDLKQYTKEIH